MNNRLRDDIENEEAVREPVAENLPPEVTDNFFGNLFSKDVWSTDAATRALPFMLYLAFLAMIYIGNRHFAEKNIRLIDKLNKEVKELNWDYKTAKADLAYKSTLTEIIKRVDADSLGLKETTEPPQKLTVDEQKDEHQN